MAWGGKRLGAGRKRADNVMAFTRSTRRQKVAVSAAVVVAADVPMPAGMPEDQVAVWSGLAPLAAAAGTLTPATSESFRDLCRAIVIRDGLFKKIQADGWTYITVKIDSDGGTHDELKRHPLVTDLRGWEIRVENGRSRFLIAPMGKPLVAAAKMEDPFAKYDGRKRG